MKPSLLALFFICHYCINSYSQPTIQWQKCLGGTVYDYANSIQQTSDGGYIVAGITASNDGDVTGNHGDWDCWVVKLNSIGTIQWQKCLGGTTLDWAYSIQQTSDSGYIVAGNTQSNNGDVTGNHGGRDCWIVKLNSAGTIQWQKCLGGTGWDDARSIQQTSDSGYIVAGFTDSNDGDVTGNHGDWDCWVVKLNSIGTIQWQKCLGGTGWDDARSIQQTSDSGYIVAGYTESNDGDVTGNHGDWDYWVVKLNSAGTIQWQKCLGGTGIDYAYSIQQTTDSGYIVAGYTESNDGDITGNHGGRDCWIVKLNSAGTIQWQKCLGGTGIDYAYSIQQTTDSGYIVAGSTASNDGDITGNHGGRDCWIVKLNSAGTIQWQKCLGGTLSDQAYSIQQTSDGGYIVAGITASNDGDVTGNHGSSECWIVKLSPTITGIKEINSPISNLQIKPNPFSQSTSISFSLNESEKISVAIYDITGRFIKNLFNGNLTPGNHQIEWNVTDGGIENGIYLLNLEGDGFFTSQKVVVLK